MAEGTIWLQLDCTRESIDKGENPRNASASTFPTIVLIGP